MDEKAQVQAGRDEVVIRLPNVFTWFQQQLPDEFKTHMRSARRSQLLAMRSLIDAALERIDEGEKPGRKRGRVEIAVE